MPQHLYSVFICRDIPWTRLNTARFALITAALGKTKSFTLKSQSHFINQMLQNYLKNVKNFPRRSLLSLLLYSQTDVKRNFVETIRRRKTKQFDEDRLCQG